MKKQDCIFCKIIDDKIPSFKIWENEKFLAILDIQPNTKGQTLLLTKEHYDSYVVDMPDELYKEFFLAAKKVSRLLEKSLNVKRVGIVMEGTGINHAHLKLYPMHGIEKNQVLELKSKEKPWFNEYPGYITTVLGEKADIDELKKLAEQIKYHNKK